MARLYVASIATALATTDNSATGNVTVMGQITDYPNSTAEVVLTTPWTTLSCPQIGGPACPEGIDCPRGFDSRGGTVEGNKYYMNSALAGAGAGDNATIIDDGQIIVESSSGGSVYYSVFVHTLFVMTATVTGITLTLLF